MKTGTRVITRTNTHVCARCGGNGSEWINSTILPQRKQGEWKKCPDCEGSGMVEVYKEIAITVRPKKTICHE